MRIDLGPFRGRLPRIASRQLPLANATVATGSDLRSGECRPFKQSALVEAIGAGWSSIARWYDAAGNDYWLRFPSDVDVVNGPVADDVWERIYYTGDSRHTEPRMSYTGPIQTGGGGACTITLGAGTPGTLDISGQQLSITVPASPENNYWAATAPMDMTDDGEIRVIEFQATDFTSSTANIFFYALLDADANPFLQVGWARANARWEVQAIGPSGSGAHVLSPGGAYTDRVGIEVNETTGEVRINIGGTIVDSGDIAALSDLMSAGTTVSPYVTMGSSAVASLSEGDTFACEVFTDGADITQTYAAGAKDWCGGELGVGGGGGADYPVNSYKMGVPAPTSGLDTTLVKETPPTLTISTISLTRPIRVETSTNHTLETDDIVRFDITSLGPIDEENDLKDLLNPNEFQITVVDDTHFDLNYTDAESVQYSAFVAGTVEQHIGPEYVNDRYYVFTYVNELGEEGPPSDPVIAAEVGPTQSVDLTLPVVDPAATTGRVITKRRLYRTSTGNVASSFRLVTELPIATLAYTDDVREEDLGEGLESVAWDPPPADMKGLRVTAQGVGVGFYDNVLCLSEPNRLHAWPTDYQLAMDYEITGIEVIDGGVVVGTKGQPYLVQGVDPRAMIPRQLESRYACVSKRSMASFGWGAVYASSQGLILVTAAGARLITEAVITDIEWEDYHPSTIHAHAHQDRYVAFYDDGAGNKGGFIFDARQPDLGFVDLGFYAVDAFVDPRERFMYILTEADNVERWDDPDSSPEPFVWRSRTFVTPEPVNLSAARVAADAYPITCRVYGDGVLRHTQTVTNREQFPLPMGYLAREWQLEFEGTSTLQNAHFSDSSAELEP